MTSIDDLSNPTCGCEPLTNADRDRITKQLDWIYLIRQQAGGRDTVVSERELAFLRIDFGPDLIDALCAQRDSDVEADR
jgi:hypothetical protein